MIPTLGAWLQFGISKLAGTDEHVSALHALVESVITRPTSWQIAHPEYTLSREHEAHLNSALECLVSGEPLPYITGKQSFYGRDFHVNPAVLIPRPETELLVERALSYAHTQNKPCLVADVGTGSGCIAVTIAAELENCRVIAVDISREVLQTAQKNARRYNLEDRIHFVQCDLLSSLTGPFDIICANLPYIPTKTLKRLDVHRHEPHIALDGGPDGMQYITPLVRDLRGKCADNCLILLEIEETLGLQFLKVSRETYPQASITIMQDLAGRDRIGIIEF